MILTQIVAVQPSPSSLASTAGLLTEIGSASAIGVLTTINTGLVGPPGPVAPISADPDNRLTTGSDDGLYVPEIVIDPLAYYILAKA